MKVFNFIGLLHFLLVLVTFWPMLVVLGRFAKIKKSKMADPRWTYHLEIMAKSLI